MQVFKPLDHISYLKSDAEDFWKTDSVGKDFSINIMNLDSLVSLRTFGCHENLDLITKSALF